MVRLREGNAFAGDDQGDNLSRVDLFLEEGGKVPMGNEKAVIGTAGSDQAQVDQAPV